MANFNTDVLKALGTGSAPDVQLFGLTPEQIANISRANIASEGQGLNLVTTVADIMGRKAGRKQQARQFQTTQDRLTEGAKETARRFGITTELKRDELAALGENKQALLDLRVEAAKGKNIQQQFLNLLKMKGLGRAERKEDREIVDQDIAKQGLQLKLNAEDRALTKEDRLSDAAKLQRAEKIATSEQMILGTEITSNQKLSEMSLFNRIASGDTGRMYFWGTHRTNEPIKVNLADISKRLNRSIDYPYLQRLSIEAGQPVEEVLRVFYNRAYGTNE